LIDLGLDVVELLDELSDLTLLLLLELVYVELLLLLRDVVGLLLALLI